MSAFSAAIVATFLVLAGAFPASAAELIMFGKPGCPWCAAWDRDIGGIYDRTEEGRRAPLRRVDMTVERAANLRQIVNIVYSPTFVLLEAGREVGRIVGYPGEHFFWPALQELLAKLPPSPAAQTEKPISEGNDS